jgi:hypothetical protein
MQKQQKLVVEDSMATFSNYVNRLMSEGWKAVPGTVTATMGLSGSGANRSAYCIVLEKEISATE